MSNCWSGYLAAIFKGFNSLPLLFLNRSQQFLANNCHLPYIISFSLRKHRVAFYQQSFQVTYYNMKYRQSELLSSSQDVKGTVLCFFLKGISQFHKILEMTENPLFICVLSLLCNMKLLLSETLCFKGFQTSFRSALKTHVEGL